MDCCHLLILGDMWISTLPGYTGDATVSSILCINFHILSFLTSEVCGFSSSRQHRQPLRLSPLSHHINISVIVPSIYIPFVSPVYDTSRPPLSQKHYSPQYIQNNVSSIYIVYLYTVLYTWCLQYIHIVLYNRYVFMLLHSVYVLYFSVSTCSLCCTWCLQYIHIVLHNRYVFMLLHSVYVLYFSVSTCSLCCLSTFRVMLKDQTSPVIL